MTDLVNELPAKAEYPVDRFDRAARAEVAQARFLVDLAQRSEPEAWTAFAILSGVPSEALAGEQLLIDQNAWLRTAWRPGEPGDWMNPQALAAEIRDIAAHPIAADAAGGHVHHH